MAIHKPSTNRFIEIDMLRGIALALMIFGHLLWDLDHFGVAPMNSGIYSALQNFVPQLFFIIVGIGLIVSKKKQENKINTDETQYYKRLALRGLKIFTLGMFLTIVSLIFFPNQVVLFGVLHCIGFSVLLSIPFLKYRSYTLLFALLFIFGGTILGQIHVDNPTIFHLAAGLHQVDVWRYTVDYFPLLPWFGFTLLGLVIGDWLYCGNTRSFKMPDLSRYKPAKLFSWMGQHSLGIYLIHQPIIAGALSVFIFL